MKFKKWIAVLLALMMLLSLLAGCAAKDDDDDDDDEKTSQSDKKKEDKEEEGADKEDSVKPTKAPAAEPTTAPVVEPTESADEAAIGAILSKPEKVFADDSEKLYMNVKINDNGTEENIGIGIQANADDSVVIYFNDGPAKTQEYVIEIAADGAIAAYARVEGAAAFIADTESDAADILSIAEEMLAIIDVVTLDPEVTEGIQYKKMASANASVYTYAFVEDGEETGTVNVDKATGIAVLMQEGTTTITVDTIDQKDARIPAYKSAASITPTTPTTPTTPATTPATTPVATTPAVDGVAIGTILDEPEVVYADESDKLYMSVTVKEGTSTQTLGLGLQANADDSVLIYFNDGPAKANEYVIEIAADGAISAYTRSEGMSAFVADTESTSEEILGIAEEMLGILEALALDESVTGDIKYKKMASANSSVYTYAMMEGSQETGTVNVDKASGLAVYLEDGTTIITVDTLDLNDSRIPSYK